MIDNSGFKAYLVRLIDNLNTLREREAKYGGNCPLELLNQIEDHQQAIVLTEQAITGKLTETGWQEALKPLLVSILPKAEASKPRLPLQRPPRATHFTDRKEDLARLMTDLQPGRVVTLCGPGGIGKTALAAEAVWQQGVVDCFPDGIIFHTFYGKSDPALALEHIARSFGEDPKPTPTEAALRVLAGKQVLLILDGVEEVKDLVAVLQVAGGCGVLLTSRDRTDAPDPAQRRDVHPLPLDEAVHLLLDLVGDQAKDTRLIQRICTLVGSLPLTVQLVGRYLNATEEPIAEYLKWLETTPIEALSHGEHREESVAVLLQRSLTQVSEAACQILRVVGLLAMTPFSREVVAAALGLDEGQIRQPLGELVGHGLLLRSGECYEVSHALVHTYAREKAQPEAEVVRRLAKYYTTMVEMENQKGLPGYHRLDTERAHIVQMLTRCADRGEWEVIQRLALALNDYLFIGSHFTEWLQVIQTALIAARQLRERQNEESFLSKLGLASYILGQTDQAISYYDEALKIACEINNRQDEGTILSFLGNAYSTLGQIERAIEFYGQSLTITREISDPRNEGATLASMGRDCRDMGQVEQAIEFYEQALALARKISDRRGECSRLGGLALAYCKAGQVERAIAFCEQALTLAREIGDRRDEGRHLGTLGNIYQDMGKVERAIEFYKQALTIVQEVGDRRSESSIFGGMGLAYDHIGEVQQAIGYYEQALTIARKIKHRYSEGLWLYHLGKLYKNQGDILLAYQCLEESLSICQEVKSPYAESARELLTDLHPGEIG